MERKKLLKRGLSLGLAFITVLTMALNPLPEGLLALTAKAGEATYELPKSDLALGAPIVPTALENDRTFKDNYIRGGAMSLNRFFKMTTDKNTNQNNGSTLTRNKIMHDSTGSGWQAVYKWNCTDAQKALLSDSAYTFKYEGNAISEKHSRTYVQGFLNVYKHNGWDWVNLELKNSNNSTMWAGESYLMNSGEGQPVSWSHDRIYTDFIEYIAQSYNCSCGESGVSGSTFYLVDTTIPRVKDAYICTNPQDAENSRVDSYAGFSASQKVTSYIVFEFSEKVRFSDNLGETLTLNLDARDNNTRIDIPIVAKLHSFDGNKMIFSYSVNPTTNGQPTDITLYGISSVQPSFVNGSFDLYLYDGEGNKANTGNQKSSCYITDIVGNALDWAGSDKNIGNIIYDNKAPKLENISINGNFITADSAKEDGLSNGAARSALFAGNGDWLQFGMSFSENVTITTDGTMYMVLNVNDTMGNPIKLACSVNGRTLTSEKLNVTETTFDSRDAGKRIYVQGMEGITKVADSYGNVMKANTYYAADLATITWMPAQGIYVDTDAPVIETGMTVENGVYTPTNLSIGTGEYFVVPIKICENVANVNDLQNTSYVEGQNVEFSIVSPGETKGFEWYVSYDDTIDTQKFQTGTTISEYKTQYSYDAMEKETAYLYVKLNKSEDYGYVTSEDKKGVFFEADIYVTVKDNAGNAVMTTFPIQYQVDFTAPTGSISSTYIHSIDYSSLESTITSNFSVSDDLGMKEISYFWTYTTIDENGVEQTETTTPQTIDLRDGLIKEYTEDVSLSIPFGEEGTYGRSGNAYLTVSYVDYAGYNGSVSSSDTLYTFDFTLAKSVYKVNGGTKINPLTVPQAYLSAPTSTATSGTDRTIILIPYSTNEDGSTNYFAYDPLDASGYSAELDLIGDILTHKSTSGYKIEANGEWKLLTGTITDGAGTFTSCDYFDGIYTSGGYIYDYDPIYNFVTEMYGSFEIIFVTSSAFDNTKSFTKATSTVETTTVYLANNATYETSITNVKSPEFADASGKLDYVAGNVPAQNLDDVVISFTLNNTTAAEANVGYGFIPLDFANSKVELVYYGTDKSSIDEIVYTWSLAETAEQSVAIPTGVANETGWYGLQITITNMNGAVTTTKMQQFYFMDNREVDIALEAYYKSYSNKDAVLSTIIAEDESVADWADGSAIEVSLGTAPGESWSVDTYFTFSKGTLTNDDIYGIQELVKVRVYNKNDADYETNAIWVENVSDIDTLKYVPVYTETITAESYGTLDNLLLPLYDGNNLICYELVNTNGVVKHHEVAIYAYAECEEWNLDVEYTEISDRTGGIMEVKVSPAVSENIDLVNSRFGYVELASYQTEDYYVFRDDFDCEFWLLDQNGNLSVRKHAVADVDGISPSYVGFKNKSATSLENFYHFSVYAYDEDGEISADELTLTFDADYSAVLMGLTGEARINNTEQITVKVPINREKDENGEYLPWESFEPGNNGIFRTKLLEEGPEEYAAGNIEVEIWGTWKYDEEFCNSTTPELYPNATKRELTFKVVDENGNVAEGTRTYGSGNLSYAIGHYHIEKAEFYEDGSMIIDPNPDDDKSQPFLNKDGLFALYSEVPFSKIYSYGVTGQKEVTPDWPGDTYFYFPLPMIQQDGDYTIEYMDLFGDIYTHSFTVNEFGNINIDVQFSETDYTNEDVTISAVATLSGDYITEMKAVTESGMEVEGVIDTLDAAKGTITMPENGKLTISTVAGESSIVSVRNIDKVLEPATVKFIDSMGCELNGTETLLEEEVTAILKCDEEIVGVDCEISYKFPRGSKTGDTYTFTYMDAAGNVGTVTAVLPCDIREIEKDENFVDEIAPFVNVKAYGMRNNKYQLFTELVDPANTYVETGETTLGHEVLVAMLEESENGLPSYIAQGYKLLLDVLDDSAVKILVQASGTAAPTAYETVTEGSNVAHVTVSGNTITITENVEFDLYIIDEANNVTALPNISVVSIDKEAPKYEVMYDVQKDEAGNSYVYAAFVPAEDASLAEKLEMIYPLDKSMPSIDMVAGEDDAGNPIMRARYYFLFTENGTCTFNYVDAYGNNGVSEANVQGFDTSAPESLNTTWTGTTQNVSPGESSKVNNDVIANISTSKAISEVNLYWYAETAEHHKGEPVTTNEPVSVSFSGTNIYVTYTANMSSIVVEFVAKENGRRGYKKLEKVDCIDKDVPVITLESAVLSENKKFMTITLKANEDVVMTEYQKSGNMFERYQYEFKKEYTWVATDNKEKTLHFTDAAGNKAEYTIRENSVVDTVLLTAVYSANEAHTDETINPAKEFVLDAGSSIWIKTNKAAEVSFGEGPITSLLANTWTELILPELDGITSLKLTDSNTKEVSYKTISVRPKDSFAPEITFASNTIILNADATSEELLTAIGEGVTIVDNTDGTITDYEVTGYPSVVTSGLYELTYRASDAAGNEAVKFRTLYIKEEGIAVLYVNGNPALPYDRTVIDSHNLSLELEGMGDLDLITIKIRDGFRSIGQMKHSTTTIENLETTVSHDGFYTIYVRTQERVEYVTYLYVEE